MVKAARNSIESTSSCTEQFKLLPADDLGIQRPGFALGAAAFEQYQIHADPIAQALAQSVKILAGPLGAEVGSTSGADRM
jgi:hypothetical protein